ncbi:YozE family protein [Lederbergia citrea]|uniref:UPF0346 protein KHA91_05000 n=1 Tax=Lederbergia citrea TaxID=2833581 RepID=A0A942UNS5_9BACI|nr:YozE family protein [Lederbergia citrea]MBS4176655.1 YozE family protein [Lederbergia citrea]MBS4203216.1 YozE family protein [Lederbergia citrea]MBS4222113.1 YozE family protein [Lederbergia citrea]
MNKSFYHFLMKYRQPTLKDELSRFANGAYADHSFPKDSEDYHEISSYLELNGEYLPTVALFDQAWELYIESENK